MGLLIGAVCGSIVIVLAIFFVLITTKRRKKAPFSLLGLAFMGILVFGTFTKIEANNVGIIYSDVNGGIQDWTYGEGYNAKSIFDHVIQISTANKSYSMQTMGQTKDGQYATFQLSLIYHIAREDAGLFYKVTGETDIPTEQLKSLIKNSLQAETIKYNIYSLLSGELETARLGYEASLAEVLLTEYHVTLVSATFDDIDAGTEVEATLKELAQAEQKIAIAQAEAEAAVEKAKGEAAAAVEAAKGAADAAEYTAQAEQALSDAEAYGVQVVGEAKASAAAAYTNIIMDSINSIYEAHLTDTVPLTYEAAVSMVLRTIFYNTWDGQLPQVLTSDSLSALIGSLIV